MSDELDDYEERVERADASEDALEGDRVLADADELTDAAAEEDDTGFDESRLQYSGVAEGYGNVDVEELEEAGALLDDPERAEPDTDT